METNYWEKMMQYKFSLIFVIIIIIAVYINFQFDLTENLRTIIIAISSGAVVGLLFEFFLIYEFHRKIRDSVGNIVDDALVKLLTVLMPSSSISQKESISGTLLSTLKIPLHKNFVYTVFLRNSTKQILSVLYWKTRFNVEYELENILQEPITLFPDGNFKLYIISSRKKQLAQKLMFSENVIHTIYVKELDINKIKKNRIPPETLVEKIILSVNDKNYTKMESKIKDNYILFTIQCKKMLLNPGESIFIKYTIESLLPELEPNSFRTMLPYPTLGARFSFSSEIPNTDIAASILLSQPIYNFSKDSISYNISTNEFVFPGNGVVFIWRIIDDNYGDSDCEKK